jgi:hypothetical protein
MDKRQRLVMLGIAAVIAAVAVVIALTSGGGDDGDDSTESTAAQTTTAQTTEQDTSVADETATTEPKPEPEEPEVTVINVKGGEPVDGEQKITVKKGDQIAITVVADAPDHAHLHGYDVEKDVGPGVKARFREKADLEGIYELELHDSGAVLAKITVEP